MKLKEVFVKPRNKTGFGSEINISKYVNLTGLSKIKKSIDSTDYSVGVYRFEDVKLLCNNESGIFNERDSRSIFEYGRDNSLVLIKLSDINEETGEATEIFKFEGFINDSATRFDINADTIILYVFSKNSLLQRANLVPGAIAAGTTAAEAVWIILKLAGLLDTLTAVINPDFNFVIDNGNFFDGMACEEALTYLLRASNSAMLMSDTEIIIRNRADEGAVFNLYGQYSLTERTNIIKLYDYNTGLQRTFNSVRLNNGAVTVTDTILKSVIGIRQLDFNLGFITDIEVLRAIAVRLISEFSYPKVELKISTRLTSVNLLQPVRVDVPFQVSPAGGQLFLPVCGDLMCGAEDIPLPKITNGIEVNSNIKFKVIEIEDDLKNYVTILKLRQTGVSINDGYFE